MGYAPYEAAQLVGGGDPGGLDGLVSGGGNKRTSDDAGITLDDMLLQQQQQQPKKIPPPNGKKTKGRVKIKMEFIDNKLRRYTTFSKRKTGIMKKVSVCRFHISRFLRCRRRFPLRRSATVEDQLRRMPAFHAGFERCLSVWAPLSFFSRCR